MCFTEPRDDASTALLIKLDIDLTSSRQLKVEAAV